MVIAFDFAPEPRPARSFQSGDCRPCSTLSALSLVPAFAMSVPGIAHRGRSTICASYADTGHRIGRA
eukprot:1944830-Rhodomonas_salina.2